MKPFNGSRTTRVRRTITVDGDVAYVPLTRGYVAIIDAADVPLVERHNWNAQVQERADGSVSVYGKRMIGPRNKQRTIWLHRVIANTPDDMSTDHKDGDGLNNRRANLQHATLAQNAANKPTPARNTSGIKGVYWNKRDGKWMAYIDAGGKKRNLGQFDTQERAAAVRKAAAEQLHGAFAR